MPELVRGHSSGKDARAIRGAVVGQDARDADAAPGEVAHRPGQKARRRLLGFVGEDFDVPEPRAVVDGHMHGLPADAGRPSAPIAVDAMPDAPDLPELLDVEMQQIAGHRPFVPIGGTRRVHTTEVIEPENGNLTLDCAVTEPLGDGRAARALEAALRAIVGVVDTGLFLGTAERVLVGYPDGRVETLGPREL